MKVKVEFDYPTIEGMIYKDEIVMVDESEFNEKKHDEKVKGLMNTGKIVWIPRKLLRKK
tara:strand:- start:1426 stop:1602 length:177 start_codon:yes stop_codon:yes gene_type:complete